MTRTARNRGEGKYVPPMSELRPSMSPRGFVSSSLEGCYNIARSYAPDNFKHANDV